MPGERFAAQSNADPDAGLVAMTGPDQPEGAIDEAVETAKAFCGAEAPGFVNGILAAVLRAGAV